MASYVINVSDEQDAAMMAEIERENVQLAPAGKAWTPLTYVKDIIDTKLNMLVGRSKAVENIKILTALENADSTLRDRIKADLGVALVNADIAIVEVKNG